MFSRIKEAWTFEEGQAAKVICFRAVGFGPIYFASALLLTAAAVVTLSVLSPGTGLNQLAYNLLQSYLVGLVFSLVVNYYQRKLQDQRAALAVQQAAAARPQARRTARSRRS